MKDRKHNGQKKKDKQHNGQKMKDRQYNGQKMKDRQHNGQNTEEQTTQWPKEKGQKDKQRSTKHTHKTKDQTPLKTNFSSGIVYFLIRYNVKFRYLSEKALNFVK
jgi:hypothetical protein